MVLSGILLASLLLCVVRGQEPNGVLNGGNGASKMKCYDVRSRPIRCVPEFVNAAFHRKVESNNTCGTPESKYCVQTLASGQKKECQYCNAEVKSLSHPSVYITDIKDDKNYTWWQSDTLYTFIRNKVYDRRSRLSPVTLILDLGKTFEVVSVRLRFQSLRPESMAIYKQTTSGRDGPWIPYQYYSRSCRSTYGIEPDDIIIGTDNLQTALCTAKYSQLVPIFGGEVLFRTLANRPGRNDIEQLPELQDWIRAYSLKFDLDRLNTFGDDLFGDANVLRSYYYAIIDLTVVGKCACNGHASKCEARNREGGGPLVCICEHFTDGVDCEKCLPFYNNRAWAAATSVNANPCEVCDCNGLADVCEFDQDLFRRTGRGGRCIGCRNDTGGPFCEKCRENYHRERDEEICRPCNCNPIGSESLQCYKDGRCYCKPGVTGDKCDRCRPNYYGFSEDGCSPCECSKLGTRQDSFQCDENGQCTCKKNVIGKNCDKCLPGHFALEADNPYGCRQCFCYGHSSDCKSAGGYTSVNRTSVFRYGLEDWRALNRKGADVTSQLATWDAREQNVRVTSINQDSLYLSAPAHYLDMKRSSYSRLFSFRFKVADTENMQFTQSDIMLISKNGLNISTSLTGQGNPVPTKSFQLYQYRLHEDPSFDWKPLLSAFDFQRLLNDLDEIKIRMTYSDQGTGFIDDISMEHAAKDPNAVKFVKWVEECTCPPPYVGLSCEACRNGHKHETVNGSSYDRCVRCECNNHSRSCDPDTGKCVCLHNTMGDDCSRCKDGFYGNPTAGTKDDCKPCPCVFGKQCVLIGSEVRCTDCPTGHQGNLCGSCVDGFYGDPTGSRGPKTRCKKCNCSGNIDTNAVQNCDSETGDCLKCIYNTRNGPRKQCELCKVGFYGDATSFPKPGCKPCNCHENGTFVPSSVDRNAPLPCDEDGECLCRENVIGKKCDMCRDQYWNINSKEGCEPCRCNPSGSYNNSCHMHSGQCVCKPGVGGRQCDKCLPDHYKFSLEGCQACSCHPDGSLDVSCDEDGRCKCRPGVLGVKCDQCGENRFNLSAGCTRCPPCYDELQVRVNKLRAILKALNESGRNNSVGDSAQNPDKEFQKRINIVKEELFIILSKAEDTSVSDKELMKRLDILNQTLVIIESKFTESYGKTSEAKQRSRNASSEVSFAEDSVQRSWDIVDEIRRSIGDFEKILDQITSALGNWTAITVRINETIVEIRDLSNAQWDEVQDLTKTANNALRNSKQAADKMNDVLEKQNSIVEEITTIDDHVSNLKSLADRAVTNASNAFNLAKITHDNAEDLLVRAQTPLEDVDVKTLKENARETTEDAKEVQEEARRLSEGKKPDPDVGKNELKRRITKIYIAENTTDGLLRQVKEANETAHSAIANGTNAYTKAKKSLKILENFNKKVNESRAKAEKAKENVSEIRRLIDSANNKTGEANREIGSGRRDAEDAKSIADLTTNIVEKSEGEVKVLEKRANDLEVPDTSIYDDVIETEKKLESYEDQADKNERVIENATRKANESKTTAETVMGIIENTRYQIIELDSMISDIPDLDYERLERLENGTRVNKELNEKLEESVKNIEEKDRYINELIKKFTLDLSELKKAEEDLRKNHAILPTKCFTVTPPPN